MPSLLAVSVSVDRLLCAPALVAHSELMNIMKETYGNQTAKSAAGEAKKILIYYNLKEHESAASHSIPARAVFACEPSGGQMIAIAAERQLLYFKIVHFSSTFDPPAGKTRKLKRKK